MQPIIEVRFAMVTNGYTSIVPVIGKKPVLDQWQKTENVTRKMLEDWSRNCPSANNTGILTKLVPTLDLDLLQEDAAIAAENMVRERFDGLGSILRRIGRPPKRAILFRTKDPFKKLTTVFTATNGADPEKIEFLGDGQQVVAHGIHPDTQAEYLWDNGGDPTTIAYEKLPLITAEQARQLQDDVVAMLARDFGYVVGTPPKKTSTTRAKTARKNPKRDRAWAEAALKAECVNITNAMTGNRNTQLNLSAYNIYQIVWGNPGLLDEQEVRERLFAAATACGLVADDGAASVWRTIESGAVGAQTQPRVRPLAKLDQPATPTWRAGLGLASAGASFGTSTGATVAASTAPAPGARTVIQMVDGERHQIVDEAEAALIAAGGFDIYQRDAIMMRPVMSKLPAANRHGIKRSTVVWRLMRVKPLYLIEMLGRCAIFQSYDRRRKDWVNKDCPQVIGETLLAREGVWHVPVLLGIVHTPQLRADGSLLITPGYDPQTQLLYKPDGEVFPEIPDRPSKEDAARALETIKQAIVTFPFTGEVDRSVALSLLLTGVCRKTLDFAPLHAITAPAPGTGKSLLIDLASILLTGQPAPVISAEIDAAEFEKRLGTALIAGVPVISLDNCTKPLDHALLCQAVTQTRLSIRILGFSEDRDVTVSALLTMNGNNLVLQGDMPRRSVRCEMDAKVERPELRVFTGPNIQTEFRRRRGEFVMALLIILRAYQVSGGASTKPALGNFEMWSRWVRDALIWLGEADPCDSTEVIHAGNPDRQKHEAVVLAWRDQFGLARLVTVRDLIEAATPGQFLLQQPSTNQRLYDALLAVAMDQRRHDSISNDRLGRWLNKVSGKYEQGMRIVRAGSANGYPRWQLSS
jgi:putative DNA primase/helicase